MFLRVFSVAVSALAGGLTAPESAITNRCEIDTNCGTGICVNGACKCPVGYSGSECEIVSCFEDCRNGECNFPNQCDCATGWTGTNCTIPTCEQSCNHGLCTAPDTCKCTKGKPGGSTK